MPLNLLIFGIKTKDNMLTIEINMNVL